MTFTPKGRIKTSCYNDKLDFVANNLGVAVLPEINIREQLACGKFISLLPDTQWHHHDLYAVYSYKDIPLRIRTFIEYLSDNIPQFIAPQSVSRRLN